MRKFLIVLLSIIGGLTLMALGLFLFVVLARMVASPRVPSSTVLEVDFEQPMLEVVPDDPIASYMLSGTPTVLDRVRGLRRAARDDRVKGLIARVGAGGMGLAVTQEMRSAIRAFRDAGKFAVVHSETFGEMGPGNGGYYLATAFDEIWLQPSGDVGLTGLILEHPFAKGTLELVGWKPRLDSRHEYKNAINFYTEEGFTEPHRESMEHLLGTWFSQIVDGIGEDRGLSEEEVRGLADRGPFLGDKAVEAGLVDGLAYRDEVESQIRDRVGGGAEFLSLEAYAARTADSGFGSSIGLVYGVGAVLRGDSGYDAFSGDVTMGSNSVSRAIQSAVDDPSVKAILFRVDCPGGSFVASDTVWRAVVQAQEAGKPVVISMGNMAASGGYFFAAPADAIVAQPGTITGSIGVFAGKMVTSGMWDKIGMTWEEVQTSRNADQYSSIIDYSDEGWEKLQEALDRVYQVFTRKVSQGRDLELDRVLEIARGRIWTGEDALELGLIDSLGGFHEAIEKAKELAGIDPERRVGLKLFPRPKSTLELFLDGWSELSEPRHRSRTFQDFQAGVRQMRRIAGGPSPHGVLTLPPVEPLP